MGEVVSVMYDPQDLRAISLQNMSLFYDAYLTLVCPESRPALNQIVFCSCCSSRRNFIRNNNLLLSGTVSSSIVKVLTNRVDPFLNYLRAKLENNVELAVSVVQDVPLFWDCYLLIIENTRNYVQVDSPLSSYYYLYLKLLKDIDHNSKDHKAFDLIDSNDALPRLASSQTDKKKYNKTNKKHIEEPVDPESKASIENSANMHLRNMGTTLDSYFSEPIDNFNYTNSFIHNPGFGVAKEICFETSKNDFQPGLNLTREHKVESITDLNALPYDINILDNNSKAALHYCYGNQEQAFDLFSRANYITTYNISFFEFYGILLYNKNDSKITSLAESIDSLYPNSHISYCLNGLSYLYQGKFGDAKTMFKKYLKLDILGKTKDESKVYCASNLVLFSADVLCLLAFCYIKLTDYDAAVALYQEAVRNQPNNFRIHYSVAQGYFSMNRKEQSLWYCSKAIKIKHDPSLFKLMGRIYLGLDELDKAKKYFLLALENNEIDSNLYLADISRRTNNTDDALEYYKKYLERGTKNKAVVLKYLIDHYETTNDYKSAEKYRKMLSELIFDKRRDHQENLMVNGGVEEIARKIVEATSEVVKADNLTYWIFRIFTHN